jgi:hypothetical protein
LPTRSGTQVAQKSTDRNIFHVNESALLLFENEFRVRCSTAALAAHLAALAEHVFPMMLVLGLVTRYAALALLIMAVIQLFVYPDACPTRNLGSLLSDHDREGSWGRVDRPLACATVRLARWGPSKESFFVRIQD